MCSLPVKWYEQQKPGLEQEFLAALDKAIAFIKRWPGRAQRIKGSIRSLPFDRFPHSVVHSVHGDELIIIRVFHMKRDPRTKLSSRRVRR